MSSTLTPTRRPPTEAVEAFRATLRGELIGPEDAAYDAARRVYNAMIDRRPALIARCAGVADVISAVTFAREHDLLLAVRGGGHNGPGLGTCDDGLVIDLGQMKGIRVDPLARTARVEGGCTLADVDHATQAFGLAVPSGTVSTTGVGGLTLGGGVGHLTRKYGLTIDNLLEVDVVLADGSFVTASAEQHPDLFWAVRGGGGNFGVITSFLFRAHPVSTIYAGPMLWPIERAEDVLRWYADYLPAATDDLNGTLIMMAVPAMPPFPEELHGKVVCAIAWCYTGPLDEADALFAPIRSRFGMPLLDWVGEMPYAALQTAFDAVFPPGLQFYWKGDFVNELSDDSIALYVQHASSIPLKGSIMGFHPSDGAASRVAQDATPWSYREARWASVIAGVSPDPADKEQIISWARASWSALHPYSAGGSYINFMEDEGQGRVAASYRDNFARLVAIKDRYDPDNLFRVNQNIRPSTYAG
jgi:FAD/FMN-containing dehydrogenase